MSVYFTVIGGGFLIAASNIAMSFMIGQTYAYYSSGIFVAVCAIIPIIVIIIITVQTNPRYGWYKYSQADFKRKVLAALDKLLREEHVIKVVNGKDVVMT